MSEPEVTTTSGRVRGVATASGAAFLGIPFAENAVGADRFTAPRPRAPWDGTWDATAHRATAPQQPYPAPIERILASSVSPGDDYLNLSVWTPDPGAGDLPVIVWIHGGAFVRGANSIPTYDGAAFARDGVVLVGVNYRLGVPGFPVLPDAPTNLALHDQLLALQWVQDNIAAFGGDPGRVTVMGESAGGMSVATLLAMPAALGLFTQAIIQSGGGMSAGVPEDLATFTRAVAEKVGVEATAAALSAVDPETLLTAQGAASLELATDPRPERWGASLLRGGFAMMPVIPAIDGDLLHGLPETLIAEGAGGDVPLLIGTTADEYNLWSIGLGLADRVTAETLPIMAGAMGVPAPVVGDYLSRRPNEAPDATLSAIITDLLFRQPAIRIAQSRAGRAEAPTFAYEFDWATPLLGLGACHAIELAFVFDTLSSSNLTRDGAPQELADAMHGAWVRFAGQGDPGWMPYDVTDRRTRRFATDGPEIVDDPRREDRLAWVGGA
ncbi:carboxylesterase/lipase family protein [Kribbia dieselivorans]|uniref:carboxylesterase/lipase family protein n=1 Tax=Kribbia dieselivorans TaxID=331526 RepID=UPI000837BF5A|nr:carboxylesterase family protein [Kribbia dieselivorans]